jgi:hypothetical protein
MVLSEQVRRNWYVDHATVPLFAGPFLVSRSSFLPIRHHRRVAGKLLLLYVVPTLGYIVFSLLNITSLPDAMNLMMSRMSSQGFNNGFEANCTILQL